MIKEGGIHGVSLDRIKDRWAFGAYDRGSGKSRSTTMCIAVFSSPYDEVMTTLKRNVADVVWLTAIPRSGGSSVGNC